METRSTGGLAHPEPAQWWHRSTRRTPLFIALHMVMVVMMFLYVSGLVAEGEKPQKQTGGLVVTKDQMGMLTCDL